ncbi:MAG TPA: GTP 3',8-cyclase MoaA [Microthrixaceae bacterium]|nr:GTP 3',8-cyclase MoaA [Microthrixaceae bacterium]
MSASITASEHGGVPEPSDLVDSFGRVHRDLRISVTDRCNFRCTYCMPVEGMTWLPRGELLTFEEIERIARLMVERFGIDSIRLTGGEPTMRAHLEILVERLAALDVDLALTTNGATLTRAAGPLRAAGLRRINISLDSLRPDRFESLTRRDELDSVLAGIDAAVAAGFDPVKINCVVMRGVNEDEVVDFARFGRERGVEVRFIEFMPLDASDQWTDGAVVSQTEILSLIHEAFPLEVTPRGHDPAERFAYADGAGHVGVIASVTRPFCESCDRVRLSAEGALRNCLFALDESDLRGPLRSGAGDAELAEIVARNVGSKWAGHAIGQVHFIRPSKSMSQIGG